MKYGNPICPICSSELGSYAEFCDHLLGSGKMVAPEEYRCRAHGTRMQGVLQDQDEDIDMETDGPHEMDDQDQAHYLDKVSSMQSAPRTVLSLIFG